MSTVTRVAKHVYTGTERKLLCRVLVTHTHSLVYGCQWIKREIRNVVVTHLYQQGLLKSHPFYTPAPSSSLSRLGFRLITFQSKARFFFVPIFTLQTNQPDYEQQDLWINIGQTQHGMVQWASESILTTWDGSWWSWFHAQEAHSYCSMKTLFFFFKPAFNTVNRGDRSLGNLSQTHLRSLQFGWVLLRHREEPPQGRWSTLTKTHPNSQSGVLYVEVQHPVPARSTQISAGERISQARKAVLAKNRFPAADMGSEDNKDGADTLFWFQSVLRRRHKCS